MGIQPGLERISALMKDRPLPWKAIHVAGTNGKGTICSMVAALLKRRCVRAGRFTSPHLIDRWDCIEINGDPVHRQYFHAQENKVKARASELNINASEFEILTATAFEIFTDRKVDIGVVEVGMGGLQDATNILTNPLVTVIAKISLDHQGFLGNTLSEIATQKAGIFKPNVPRVIDRTNSPEVLSTLEKVAGEVGAGPLVKPDAIDHDAQGRDFRSSKDWCLAMERRAPHEQINAESAYTATYLALKEIEGNDSTPNMRKLLPALRHRNRFPGRLQDFHFRPLASSRHNTILLDGAHNDDSARVLADYVHQRLRRSRTSGEHKQITWVLAMSKGKDLSSILRQLLQHHGDNVITCEFGSVDGMPWVRPTPSSTLESAAREIEDLEHTFSCGANVPAALFLAQKIAKGPVVVAGSLYLVSDVLRMRRDYYEAKEGEAFDTQKDKLVRAEEVAEEMVREKSGMRQLREGMSSFDDTIDFFTPEAMARKRRWKRGGSIG